MCYVDALTKKNSVFENCCSQLQSLCETALVIIYVGYVCAKTFFSFFFRLAMHFYAFSQLTISRDRPVRVNASDFITEMDTANQ